MEDHHIAAHHVARHLRAIAELLPRLSAQGSDPLYDLLEGAFRVRRQHDRLDFVDLLGNYAAKIEATAPFDPVDDATKDDMREEFTEQLADRNSREILEDYCGEWNEADWRAEADDRQQMLNDELAHNGRHGL